MTAQQFLGTMDSSDLMDGAWGFRRITSRQDRKVSVGDVLEPSFLWVDNNITEEVLDGTSAIGFDSLDSAVKALDAVSVYSGQLVIISGQWAGNGQDRGEILVRNARVEWAE